MAQRFLHNTFFCAFTIDIDEDDCPLNSVDVRQMSFEVLITRRAVVAVWKFIKYVRKRKKTTTFNETGSES